MSNSDKTNYELDFDLGSSCLDDTSMQECNDVMDANSHSSDRKMLLTTSLSSPITISDGSGASDGSSGDMRAIRGDKDLDQFHRYSDKHS